LVTLTPQCPGLEVEVEEEQVKGDRESQSVDHEVVQSRGFTMHWIKG